VHEPLLQDALRERLAGTEVRILTAAPATGAVRLAGTLPRPELEIL